MDEERMRMVSPVLRVPVNVLKCWLDDRNDIRPIKKLIREGFFLDQVEENGCQMEVDVLLIMVALCNRADHYIFAL